MKQRTSIFNSLEVERLKRPSQKNFSQRIANICGRYSEIVKLESPLNKFTFPELGLLRECFENKIIKTAGIIRYIPHKIEEAIEEKRLDDKYEVNKKKLLVKLKKLSYVQNVALIEHIEEYWDSIKGGKS